MSHDTPQRKGHRFQNPWPGVPQHGFRDFLRWSLERRQRKSPAPRGETVPPTAAPAFELPRAAPETLTATWIGHTTVLLQVGGLNVLTDPIWSSRASPFSFAGPKRHTPAGVNFEALPLVDAVLISHDHYDHLDSETVRRLAARFPAAEWRVPLGVGAFVRSRGASEVKEMGWHDQDLLCGLSVTCVPAQHFSGRGLLNRNGTLWCGWVVRSANHSVFFAGDTALNPSFADIGSSYGPFDLALMPIGAYEPRWFMRSVHMDPEESIEAVRMLAKRDCPVPTVLATHWGTFKLTDEPLDEPPARMKNGWASEGLPPDKLWIMNVGQTRVL